MLHRDEKLLADLVALNDRGGGFLHWPQIRAIARRGSVAGSTRESLGDSPAARLLLTKVDRLLARRAAKRARVFLAHSFHKPDASLVAAVRKELRGQGLAIVTGERPSATYVSAKVLSRIDSTWVFVALFTCIPGTNRPSPWLVSELGYVAKKPRVVLLERPMSSREVGGIQGDLEYIPFSRKAFVQVFRAAAKSATDAARKGVPEALGD